MIGRGRWSTAAVVVLVLAVVTAVVPSPPAIAAAPASAPSSWRCVAKDLSLGEDQVAYAPVLNGDRRPDGSAIKPGPDGRGKYVPVLLIHGWTSQSNVSNPDDRTGAFSHRIDLSPIPGTTVSVSRSLLGQLQNLPGAAVFTFDYHPYSGRWVDDTHLGPALGKVIDCLYRAGGGEKVILVGHSMGGLVARYAAESRAAEISTVVTFGTPETGSLAAELLDTALAAGSASAQAIGMLRMILSVCGRLSTSSITTDTLCDWLPAFVRAFDSAAGRALRAGSPQLGALPPFPGGVRVDALAGDATLTSRGSGWFALPSAGDIAIGDVIVTAGSAVHGAGTSRKSPCSYQVSAIEGIGDQINLVFEQVAKSEIAQPITDIAGPCFHTSLMRNVVLTGEATGAINDDIAARSPMTAEDLVNAPVPAACGHSAGTLRHGSLPGIPANEGVMQLAWLSDPKEASSLFVAGDLTGDSVPDAAAVLDCDAGGVPWPNLIAFYGRGPKLLGSVDLGEVGAPGYGGGENTVFNRLRYASGGVVAEWSTQQEGDPAATASLDYTGTFRWTSRHAVTADLKPMIEKPTAADFLTAMGRGDVSAARKIAEAAAISTTSRYGASHTDVLGAKLSCGGELSIPESLSPQPSDSVAADRYCWVHGADGSYLILSMVHTGFGRWAVGSAYVA
jgi:pimeloyl-ACP methyl ester carboxylesterase